MTPVRTRVVKVGGSLFDLPDLDDRLRSFLQDDLDVCNLVVAGGGRLVDEVRRLDTIAPLDVRSAHWLCIDLMSVTARLLAERMVEEVVPAEIALVSASDQPASTVVDVARWLRDVEPTIDGAKLTVGWEVSSDSIAARLAVALNADELVLLKSALPTGEHDLDSLACSGYVDTTFPKLAAELPAIRFVDLRNAGSFLVRGAEN